MCIPAARNGSTRLARTSFALGLALAGFGTAGVSAGAFPVVIDNGTIELGVGLGAALNVDFTPAAPEGGLSNPFIYGLRDIATGLEGVSGGDPLEGWGIADLNSTTSGGASSLGGTFNLTLIDWTLYGSGTVKESSGDRVVITYDVGPPAVAIPLPTALLRITHDFHPSIVARLYEIEVTVENLYFEDIRPRYRRLVDWDIAPSEFNEYVTIEYGPSTAVVASVFTGFVSPDPLDPLGGVGSPTTARAEPEGTCLPNTEEVDCGPGDYGAAIDFEFPVIPPGGKMRFWLYYGAAPTETAALAALDEVGASAYTLGQSATGGTPMTFMLGFKAPWAILDNGTVELGIDMFGALNVHGGTYSTGTISGPQPEIVPPPVTGLRHVGTNFESLAYLRPHEGWGVGDANTFETSGTWSVIDYPPPIVVGPEGIGTPAPGFNMSPEDLDVSLVGTLSESVGRRANVTTLIGDPPILKVIHDFHPSSSPNLYEVYVVLENLSGSPIDPYYRRIADWDVEPSPTSELVTIDHKSSHVAGLTGSGFNSPNPGDSYLFTPCTSTDTPFVDCGPGDLGMTIDFHLDEIPPGGKEQFHLYYGAADDETAALAALSQVGVEAYSFGQFGGVLAPEALLPPTFMFGFKDVLFVDGFETADSTRWSTTVPAP